MSELSRIGVAIDSDLLARFDKLIRRRGYANRSEAFRDLIRDELVDELGLTSLHPRSVRRDLEALQAAGIDVDVHAIGRGKVWKLGPGVRGTHKITATATELIALSLSRDLLSPLLRVFAFVGDFLGSLADRVGSLATAGADRAELDGHFAAILNMYRGDGWFVDGWNQQFDSYNFWGFQLYLHLLLDRDAAWRERYGSTVKEITELHEQTFAYWVDADGNLVGHGRSLTYRFAAVCGLQWSQISGLTSTAPGLARRISSGCIKAFLEQGCLRGDGTMSIGFHRENTTVGEDYTGLGSPYWSVTGLMALLLPEDHPCWFICVGQFAD